MVGGHKLGQTNGSIFIDAIDTHTQERFLPHLQTCQLFAKGVILKKKINAKIMWVLKIFNSQNLTKI